MLITPQEVRDAQKLRAHYRSCWRALRRTAVGTAYYETLA